MGTCFSSGKAEQAASAVVHAVQDYLEPGPPPSHTTPTSPKVKQVIPGARITRMPDGDTFTCVHTSPETGAETTSRVRVMAIDCPETRQNYGQEATQYARTLIDKTSVTLHIHTTDRYNRIVADVITASGDNFAEKMLDAGAAWHYKAYDKRPNLARLENDAREARRGLWQYPRPQAPWDYRRRQRQAK